MRKSPAPSKKQQEALWYSKAMEQLVEVVQRLSLARELETVMEIVRQAARQLTGADGATFILRDADRCFYADEEAIAPLWKGQRFPMSACISGWVMLNRESAVIEDIYSDSRIPADAYRPTFVKSLAMVPIRIIEPIGAIGTYWAERHHPAPEEVKVLQALADATALAIENVQVYSELERRVEQRTSELQVILDNVQAGIAFMVHGRVVRANPKLAEIFHIRSSEALLGMPMERLLRTPEGTGFDSCWLRLSEGKVLDVETRLVRLNQTPFWAHMLAKPIDSARHPDGEIWVINDISEVKAKEKTLNELRLAAEEATRFKSEFLATMSHEIRTPLTGMLGMLELLSLTRLDIEQSATLDAAWDSGRGLLRIVSDILDWSKIEEGKLELSLCTISVPQLLQEVVNTYSRTASAKSLLLRQYVDPRLGLAHLVDSLRLSQVLNNFVSNAIKFTQQGEIEIRADLLDRLELSERVCFSVKDTGVGIAREAQEQLFQRYRQESADTARMYGGTGLGLAICRRLAEMMDGQIKLESEPGHGSIFSITLTLPLSDSPEEEVRNLHPEVKQRDIKPLLVECKDAPWVLVVDDHPVNRDLLARQIRLLGLRAEVAENGQAALVRWQEGDFAMVITDCHMPEMDGYELAREMRKVEEDELRTAIPIIAWTANAHAEEAGRCYAAGMDEILVKPANLLQLKITLAKWLDKIELEKSSSPVSGQGMEEGPIDYAILNEVVADSVAQHKVLKDFLTHICSDHARLRGLIEQGDRAKVESTAHRMNGSCRMVGARPLARICAAIESAAQRNGLAEIMQVTAALDKAVNQLESYIMTI